MKTSPSIDHPKIQAYRRMELRDLLRLIVKQSDRQALQEFHDHRTIFTNFEGRHMRFAEYLRHLCNGALAQFWGQLSFEAYDQTIDKFNNLPQEGENGIDCRKYFQAVLDIQIS